MGAVGTDEEEVWWMETRAGLVRLGRTKTRPWPRPGALRDHSEWREVKEWLPEGHRDG